MLYRSELILVDFSPFFGPKYSNAVPQPFMLYRERDRDAMGTIVPRKRKDGTTGYHAQLMIKRSGKIAHRETRTFDRRQAAAAWHERRENELAKPNALERTKAPDPTLAFVIDRYTEESIRQIGPKAQVLRAVKRYDIANKPCSEITSADIVSFANQLVAKVVPQTVGNYLSHLGSIFAIARPAWGYALDPTAMKDAFIVTRRLGVSRKSLERDRRPTLKAQLVPIDARMGILARTANVRGSAWAPSINLERVFGLRVTTLLRQLVVILVQISDKTEKAELIAKLILHELTEAPDAPTFLPLPASAAARRVAHLAIADPRAAKGIDELARSAATSHD